MIGYHKSNRRASNSAVALLLKVRRKPKFHSSKREAREVTSSLMASRLPILSSDRSHGCFITNHGAPNVAVVYRFRGQWLHHFSPEYLLTAEPMYHG